MSAVALALVVIVGIPVSIVALRNAGKVKVNAASIGRLEHSDTVAGRQASARQCERGNYTRAELHVAYLQPPTPPALIEKARDNGEPVLAFLLSSSGKGLGKALHRVRTLNPILLCTPNLKGKGAKVLSAKEQAAFVKRYKALKLDPLPTLTPPR